MLSICQTTARVLSDWQQICKEDQIGVEAFSACDRLQRCPPKEVRHRLAANCKLPSAYNDLQQAENTHFVHDWKLEDWYVIALEARSLLGILEREPDCWALRPLISPAVQVKLVQIAWL